MATVVMRDVSRSGHVLGGAEVTGLAERPTLGALVEHRVRHEVAAYNADPGPVYRGLVQPEDATRYSDGLRMPAPRPLDADRFVTAVREAVAAGLLRFRVGDDELADLEAVVDLSDHDEVDAVMDRPVVARRPG